jgi:hypothetical protein
MLFPLSLFSYPSTFSFFVFLVIVDLFISYQCGFPRNRSTTDQIFCICQILEKRWDYSEAVHQLFVDFKKAYDSARREILYNILRVWGPMKLVRLIKCV